MNGALTINYSSQDELVAICKALAAIGAKAEPVIKKTEGGTYNNAADYDRAVAEHLKKLSGVESPVKGSSANSAVSAASLTTTGASSIESASLAWKSVSIEKKRTYKVHDRNAPDKPDIFQLKKQGWKIKGPYVAGNEPNKFKALYAHHPDDWHVKHSYRVGTSKTGQSAGLTEEQVKDLLADAPAPVKESPKQPFTLESVAKDALAATDHFVNVGQQLVIICDDCKNEKKSTDIVKKIANNRYKEQEAKAAILKHNALTGHERFRTEIAEELVTA